MEFEIRKIDSYMAIYPRNVVLVTTIDNKGKPNIITLAWTMNVSFRPPIVAISIANTKRYSYKLLQEVEEYVVNVPTREIIKEVLFCGRNSGKDVDKFKATKLTPLPANFVKPPIIKECVGFIECQVINKVKAGDHTVFFGKVLDCYVKKDYSLDKKGYDLNKTKLIYHLGKNDFTVNSSELMQIDEWWK
ncbi:MAG: flavin reductase family protein [Promethearchaeota archaeon]